MMENKINLGQKYSFQPVSEVRTLLNDFIIIALNIFIVFNFDFNSYNLIQRQVLSAGICLFAIIMFLQIFSKMLYLFAVVSEVNEDFSSDEKDNLSKTKKVIIIFVMNIIPLFSIISDSVTFIFIVYCGKIIIQ